MARCNDCNKFVSYDEPTAEIESEEVDDDGTVAISVRLALPCAECGSELMETSFDFEIETDHQCPNEAKERLGYELIESNADYTDRYEAVSKSSKPIKPRYQKHFYGVDVTGNVKCLDCAEEIDFVASDEVTASGMDEL